MAKASDNPYPSILIEEATEPTAPTAGHQRLYIDSTSHHLSRTDSSGAEVDIEAAAAGLVDQGSFTYLDATEAAAPATPAAGKVRVYAKADGRIYSMDDAGAESGPFSAASGGGSAATNLTELAVEHGAMTIYDFQETAGTTATDRSRSKLNATYGSGIILNDTPPGDLLGAVDFPGTSQANDRITLSGVYAQGNVTTWPWSFEMVLLIDGPGSVGDGSYVTLLGSSTTTRYLVHSSNGSLLAQHAGRTAATAANGTFPIASWFHVVHAYDPTTTPRNRLWVNGNAITLTAEDQYTSGWLVALVGGHAQSNYVLNGKLAFFAMYPWAFSDQDDVDAHYTMSGL